MLRLKSLVTNAKFASLATYLDTCALVASSVVEHFESVRAALEYRAGWVRQVLALSPTEAEADAAQALLYCPSLLRAPFEQGAATSAEASGAAGVVVVAEPACSR